MNLRIVVEVLMKVRTMQQTKPFPNQQDYAQACKEINDDPFRTCKFSG